MSNGDENVEEKRDPLVAIRRSVKEDDDIDEHDDQKNATTKWKPPAPSMMAPRTCYDTM